MKKLALLLALCMMFSVLAGCGNDADTTPTKDAAGNETTPTQGGIIGALEDLLTQTYEFDCGASVTAPIGMNPLDAPGYTAALSGLNVAFVLLEENKAAGMLTGYSLTDYANLVQIANSLPSEFSTDACGNLYTTKVSPVEGTDWLYYITVHESAESFWLVQFACQESQYSLYEDLFAQWSASLRVPGGKSEATEPPVVNMGETQVYEVSGGYTVSAPAGLGEMDMPGYNGYFANSEVGFVVLVENKAELGLEGYTLEDYCAALCSVNGYDPFVKNEYGVYVTEYTYSDTNYSFWYYTTALDTEEAFIMLQYYTFADLAEDYRPIFAQCATTLEHNGN
jgi:hypothetical protein